jgi:hypothetical protein
VDQLFGTVINIKGIGNTALFNGKRVVSRKTNNFGSVVIARTAAPNHKNI